ncbi:MAG TPA: aminotransferase class V-fold PLP-dependent enzyme [Solirubrobacteraceae bacterium]|nr:aminotransferase class V-fold PLP-dependent enzyme [Solirubrobacteraceae bacterium]
MVDRALLLLTAELAAEHLAGLAERPAGAQAGFPELRAVLGGPLPEEGVAAERVIEELARDAAPGLVASPGPRYFGFVTGGALPAALAADWLASAWDQNAFSAVSSPAAALVEEVVAGWLLELFGLPSAASVGLTTGAQMANVAGLAAARGALLAAQGWDVDARGLAGAPPVRVLAGEEAHVTVFRALRLLGFGRSAIETVDADGQGRMDARALAAALAAGEGPAIVCAQAGNVNTGACDPLRDVVGAAREHGAWVHVDGAFGLWAAASPALSPLVAGAAGADSWATDGHKWLNVPYDCGIVAVRDPEAHRAAMGMTAAYLVPGAAGERSSSDFVPEASRRARGFAVYAALRSLGRSGVAELVERCCALALRLAERLRVEPGIEVLNEVVLNQVLLRVGDDDATTDAVVGRVQADGTCWLGGTRWQGRAAMRVSVSNWSTTEADVDRAAEAIVNAAAPR